MSKEHDVICIGLITANIPIYPVSNAVFDADVTMVNRLDIVPGGDASNQAIVLSRLGRKTGLCAKIGPDLFGRCLTEGVEKNNVDTSAVVVDNSVSTSGCAVLIHKNGSRHFLVYREANEQFSLDEIPIAKILNSHIISIGSLLALPLFKENKLTEFLKKAREQGVITASDTKDDNYHVGWKGIKDSLKYIDYFLPSYVEASYLSEETEPGRIADFFMNAGVKNLIIKMGAQGCYLRSAGREEIVPTFEAEVIDTTGAGDNFVAGFLHALLYGWDILECCKFANAVAAISTTKIGAVTAVESEIQVKEYMQTHNLERNTYGV